MSLARVDPLGGDYAESLYDTVVRARSRADLTEIDSSAVEEYHALGFLAVDHALDGREVGAAIEGLSTLIDTAPTGIDLQFEAWAGDPDLLGSEARMDAVRKLMKFVDKDERLRAIAYRPDLVAIVERILDSDDIVLFQDMALLKPPGGGREKPWHQDKAFFNIDLDARIAGVWIALDQATPANGCMHVIPGSHKEGPVPHFKRRDWQICDTDVATARDVVVPLEPGGLLFFDGYIHHGTPANSTETRRRALQFHYVDRNVLSISEEARLEVFGREGRGAEC